MTSSSAARSSGGSASRRARSSSDRSIEATIRGSWASVRQRVGILRAVATAEDVQRSIRALAKKLADASVDPDLVPNRTILAVCPDLGIAYRMELKDAKLRGIKETTPQDHTDARITARSDDLIALLDGRLNAAIAFLTGKVRIDASAKDMMLLRRLF